MAEALSFSLVAGEASGDLLAGLLLGGMRKQWPDMHSAGIGGPRMAAQGFEPWWPYEKLAVRGYVEVLRHYREIVGIRQQLRERLLANPPSAFIGVDAPDFNLDLEHDLKAQGIPTIHFVCPSIWAWRADRVERIRQSVDHVLCIFPFETNLLAQHGIEATYVGHPLAQTIPEVPDRAAARAALGLPQDATVVALLPGSRSSEIEYLAHHFLQAAQRMAQQQPGLHFVLPAMPALRARIEAIAQGAGEVSNLILLNGQSHAALAACDVTLIASGTATLEAALFKRPMVIAYNMNWLSWQIMRRKKLQPWVGLPNVLCQDFVVPELLQDAATPDALAHAVLQWLRNPAAVTAVQQRFAMLHDTLRRDTPALAAYAIEKVLAR
ncbi:lipid-A-disaccharide synthase [Limnohabitans sp.]|uniref:lipid-A-disaccharide synthase n=1 Tax=Limnohabitans sp. TaxID=1907725 RepID=UPI00286F406E|nr:lipid-A-disaccharide synthase [Limnohabitans sp.]